MWFLTKMMKARNMSDHFKFKIYYLGKESDVIELFHEHILIQELDSKAIHLITYKMLEESNHLVYNDNIERNNVISLRYYKCQEKKEDNGKESSRWKEIKKKQCRI